MKNPKLNGGALVRAYNFIGPPYTPFASFYRARMDEPARNKGHKTLSPRGLFPPPFFLKSAVDGHRVWFITESDEKAESLKSCGFSEPCGAGGTQGGILTKSQKGKEPEPQPLVKRFIKPEHAVFIVMDSDRLHNPSVALGEARLARAFLAYGCAVRLVEVPDDSGMKQGPDDFLARHGAEAFQRLVTAAVPAHPLEWACSTGNPDLLEHLPFQAALCLHGVEEGA